MSKFTVFTLFPEQIENALSHSIMKRAMEDEKLSLNCVNIRDFTEDPHGHVDDAPFGGGAGMLMQVQPIVSAFEDLVKREGRPDRVIYCSPRGKVFKQSMAMELAKEEHILFLCGHYEGIDQRALDILEVEEVSIGDYVLTGGELPAVIMIDAIARLQDGVLNKKESFEEESFSQGLLEYPQYTKPEVFDGMKVPSVLLSGNHERIRCWRLRERIAKTLAVRPDMIGAARQAGVLTEEAESCIAEITRIQGECNGFD